MLVAALGACASRPLTAPAASADAILSLRAANLAAVHPGAFQLAPGVPASVDRSLGGLRGSSMEPPGGSFSRYLREVIEADLRGAGLLDPNSDAVIVGELTASEVDAAVGTGTVPWPWTTTRRCTEARAEPVRRRRVPQGAREVTA